MKRQIADKTNRRGFRMIFVTFREYFLGKKLSFVEMAILCLSGRAIPRVLSESLPAERALWLPSKWAVQEPWSCRKVCPLKGLFWTFQVSTRLSDFSKCIYNNSYCYYNKKLFHEKSQNFFEKSRGFFYLFFWKFYSAIRFNVYNNFNFNFKNQKHLFKNFHFYFVRNNIRQK